MKHLTKSWIGALALVLGGQAWAAPWISVPSTPTPDQRLVVNGGDLVAGSVVLLRIEHPGGTVTSHTVNADSQGRLRFEYTLTVPGGYGVEAMDAAGKLLGKGRLGFMR